MNTNSPYTLDAQSKLQLEQIAARKPSLVKRLIGFVLVIGIAYAAYAYRNDLLNMIKKPAATDAAANPGDAPGGRGGRGGGRGGRGGFGATTVVSYAAKSVDMPVYLRGLGTVTPYANVTVKSRVDGQLVAIKFEEGQLVKQGDLLAEIDKRPFEVQLQQGKAQLAQAEGQLARDTALLRSAKTEYDRDQDLLKRGLIAKQQVDIQSAAVDQYQGSIQADHASMENAQAAIASAELQITYSQVTSPITGRIGLRLVDPGNIVRAADPNGLVVIAQVQPITVVFNLPEDDIGRILKKLQSGQKLRVEAYDRDDTDRLATGTLLAVDNQIDQTTGTSRLKAIFDNKDDALFPNQFVNVHLLLEVQRNATVVPAAAIQRGPQGTYVFVVNSGKAQIRPVTVKTLQGNDVALGPELQKGEMVIIEGADKVQDGGRVEAQVADASGHDPAPVMVDENAGGPGPGNGGRRGGGGGFSDGKGGRGGRGGRGAGNGR
jgi:multidrug efflux system membrane fusion protein